MLTLETLTRTEVRSGLLYESNMRGFDDFKVVVLSKSERHEISIENLTLLC